jgi:hypothetical protein
MTFQQFIVWLGTPEGHLALGTGSWALTAFAIVQINKRRTVPFKLDGDDKRLIALGMVVVVTVVVRLLAIMAGYESNTIEGWFNTLTQIAGVGIILFTATRFVENKVAGTDQNEGAMDGGIHVEPVINSRRTPDGEV